jgi:hydrogenase maturation protein HypF
MILRRARGYAPDAVTTFPSRQPILALGGDLKNAITLVIDGQAFVSQHIGDLSNYGSRCAFEQAIKDLTSMYGVDLKHAAIAHDTHPAYFSASYAHELPTCPTIAVQHHRAHVASVLAEKQAWTERVLGISFDGTGWGDDGTIWGGEFFIGSLVDGFRRVQHMRPTVLPGGDSAIRFPLQAAAGFLSQLSDLPDLSAAPFHFGDRYFQGAKLASTSVQTFETTSIGRLFDVAAALLGFTREMTFEGQAAMWLEHLAGCSDTQDVYLFPVTPTGLDFHPLLTSIIEERKRDRPVEEIARAFHRGVANGAAQAAVELCQSHKISTVVLSGGVFQNPVLLRDVHSLLSENGLRVWTNSAVPPNDGGLSLGQAAIAAFSRVPHA